MYTLVLHLEKNTEDFFFINWYFGTTGLLIVASESGKSVCLLEVN